MQLRLMVARENAAEPGNLSVTDKFHVPRARAGYPVKFAIVLLTMIPAEEAGIEHDLLIYMVDNTGQAIPLPTLDTGNAKDSGKLVGKLIVYPDRAINRGVIIRATTTFSCEMQLPHEGEYELIAVIDGRLRSSARFRVIDLPWTASGRIEVTGCGVGVKFSGGRFDLPDLRIISRGNRVAIDISDETEVEDYGTIIE